MVIIVNIILPCGNNAFTITAKMLPKNYQMNYLHDNRVLWACSVDGSWHQGCILILLRVEEKRYCMQSSIAGEELVCGIFQHELLSRQESSAENGDMVSSRSRRVSPQRQKSGCRQISRQPHSCSAERD